MIVMAHMVMAAKVPEFAITEAEAAQLAVAICNYARHTNFRVTAKTMDLTALLSTLFAVEGTRIIAVLASIRNQRAMMARQQNGGSATGAAPGPVQSSGGNIARFTPGSIPGVG